MQLSDIELNNYVGGTFNATLVNAVIRGFTFILDLGKTIGTAIRRGISGNVCGFWKRETSFFNIFYIKMSNKVEKYIFSCYNY